MISKELILKRIREVYFDYEKCCKEKEMLRYALKNLIDIYNSDIKIEEKEQMIYQNWDVAENYIINLLNPKNIYVGVDLGKNKDTHVEKISIPKKNNFISVEEKEDEVVVQVTSKEEKYPFKINSDGILYAQGLEVNKAGFWFGPAKLSSQGDSLIISIGKTDYILNEKGVLQVTNESRK